MRKIISIEHKESRVDKHGDTYYRTYVLLDDGSDAIGFGNDFEIGDLVEVFYDKRWDVVKMRKTPESTGQDTMPYDKVRS